MARLKRSEASEILAACNVPVGADFHVLGSSQVDALLAAAVKRHYRKPQNANGSRARCFHDYVQRAAKDRPFRGFVTRSYLGDSS